MTGRLGRALVGPKVPADGQVSVGAIDHEWEYGQTSFVVSVSATGPVRVQYCVTSAGPAWLRVVEISERRRRRVMAAVLGCGALEGAGARLDPVARFGWVHVVAGGRSSWAHLPPDGRLGGVAVLALVGDLVPRWTWRELAVRRGEWWDLWAARSLGTVAPAVREVDRTMRPERPERPVGEGRPVRPVEVDSTRVEAVDQGPWDSLVAGRPRPLGQGWPGIRRGEGHGGVW